MSISNLDSECVAEHARRPLYAATVGTLGVDPISVDQALDKILRLSSRWGAILLFDEADVFLDKRSNDDFEHNAMVSGMFYT
jgi:hypothetical protein